MSLLKIKEVRFEKSVVITKNFPPESFPEVAFAGRSNVGKSSLMNKLLNRKNLVRTSKNPGCTRSLNYFFVDTSVGGLYFVDLPGYGYAKISEKEQKKWADLIEFYFKNRSTLHLVLILIDIRRGLEFEDEMLIDYLNYCQKPMLIVVTKIDKLSSVEREKRLNYIKRQVEPITPVSAKTGEGIDELWREILRYTYPGSYCPEIT